MATYIGNVVDSSGRIDRCWPGAESRRHRRTPAQSRGHRPGASRRRDRPSARRRPSPDRRPAGAAALAGRLSGSRSAGTRAAITERVRSPGQTRPAQMCCFSLLFVLIVSIMVKTFAQSRAQATFSVGANVLGGSVIVTAARRKAAPLQRRRAAAVSVCRAELACGRNKRGAQRRGVSRGMWPDVIEQNMARS